jgi:hypothetical protein
VVQIEGDGAAKVMPSVIRDRQIGRLVQKSRNLHLKKAIDKKGRFRCRI